jgi:hypothetical protein
VSAASANNNFGHWRSASRARLKRVSFPIDQQMMLIASGLAVAIFEMGKRRTPIR